MTEPMQKRSPVNINLQSDGHVHTKRCNHATGEMEEYVQAAISRKLEEIVFLEHMETGICHDVPSWLTEEDFVLYREEGLQLREKYRGRIDVRLGIELGYNRDCPQEVLARVLKESWDRIGISCHFLKIPGESQHLNILSRRQINIDRARRYGPEQLLTDYFDQLNEAVSLLPGDVLCHLDAGLRYTGVSPAEDHFRQIEKLLAAVKKKGMALEINTSGYSLRQEPFPARRILKMALEMGIPLVAGSDAHRPEDVGRDFPRLKDYISSALSP